MLYICIEYCIQINMYHVSSQAADEHMINVHYYYYHSLYWYQKRDFAVQNHVECGLTSLELTFLKT